MDRKYLICVIIFISVILIIFNTKYEFFESKESAQIPKKIWLFWNESLDKAPNIVKFCVNTIYKLCPDYEINVLSLENYKKYVEDQIIISLMDNEEIKINHKSDLIRFYLLYKYGGIYLDSSIIILQSFDWLNNFDYNNFDFVIYYKYGNRIFVHKSPFVFYYLFREL